MRFPLLSALAGITFVASTTSQLPVNQIAVFSSRPSADLIERLSSAYGHVVLTVNQSPVPKPEVLTFDNSTHILVWKFTKEQRDYLKKNKDFVGIEDDKVVHIAPFTGVQTGTNVEEQGSDAPSLDGSTNPLVNNAHLNGTPMVTQTNVPNWVSWLPGGQLAEIDVQLRHNANFVYRAWQESVSKPCHSKVTMSIHRPLAKESMPMLLIRK